MKRIQSLLLLLPFASASMAQTGSYTAELPAVASTGYHHVLMPPALT